MANSVDIILDPSKGVYQDGVKYCQEGCVKILSMNNGRIHASVHGTRLEYVEINVDTEQDIIEHACTCFDDSNEYCKHTIATFLQLEDTTSRRVLKEEIEWNEDDYDDDSDNYYKAPKFAQPADLPDHPPNPLDDYNDDVYDYEASKFAQHGTMPVHHGINAAKPTLPRKPLPHKISDNMEPTEMCKAVLDHMYNNAKNARGRITNKERVYFGIVDELASKHRDVLDTIDTYVATAWYISENIDIVDNLKGYYTSQIIHMMRRIIKNAKGMVRDRDGIQKRMQRIFTMYMQEKSDHFANMYFETLYKMCINENDYAYITGLFSAHQDGSENIGQIRRSSEQILEAETELRTQSGQEDLENFLFKHHEDSPSTYVRYIWLLLDRDKDRALEEANKAIDIFPNSTKITNVALQLSEAAGGRKHIEFLIKLFVRTCNWGYYDQARDLAADWNNYYLESILSNLKDSANPNMRIDVLLHEGMHERAFKEVIDSNDLNMLDAYSHELCEKYPDKSYEFYAERISNIIKSIDNAEQHEEARRHIMTIQLIPKHKKDATRFLNKLARQHPQLDKITRM